MLDRMLLSRSESWMKIYERNLSSVLESTSCDILSLATAEGTSRTRRLLFVCFCFLDTPHRLLRSCILSSCSLGRLIRIVSQLDFARMDSSLV